MFFDKRNVFCRGLWCSLKTFKNASNDAVNQEMPSPCVIKIKANLFGSNVNVVNRCHQSFIQSEAASESWSPASWSWSCPPVWHWLIRRHRPLRARQKRKRGMQGVHPQERWFCRCILKIRTTLRAMTLTKAAMWPRRADTTNQTGQTAILSSWSGTRLCILSAGEGSVKRSRTSPKSVLPMICHQVKIVLIKYQNILCKKTSLRNKMADCWT